MAYPKIINKDLIVAIYKRDIKTLQQYLEKYHKNVIVIEMCDCFEMGEECDYKDDCKECEYCYKITAFELVYALCNIFRYYEEKDYNIYKSMMDLFFNIPITPILPKINYGDFSFITYNDDVYDYFEDYDFVKYKPKDIDIQLANCGMKHKQEEVIKLLKQGASPYIENDLDLNQDNIYTYYNVAPMLDTLETDIEFIITCLIDDIIANEYKEDSSKLSFVNTFINVLVASAHIEILSIVDKYILPEVRKKGEELMQRKLGEVE
ncbi:MAG: hypothetical protein LKE30_00700 [Bacteroidales bacterium]|jgi:hypothetical protein|nr:hypothetical protein [Bacteroidales bacterium]